MNDGFSIRITKADDVSPRLRRAAAAAKSPRLMHAIGTGLVGHTKRSFNFPAMRPAAWQVKKDGSPATLKSREATLWRSIRVVKAEATRVRIGSDRPYAAIHQLGGKTRPMVARPYFPFTSAGQITPGGAKTVEQILGVKLRF